MAKTTTTTIMCVYAKEPHKMTIEADFFVAINVRSHKNSTFSNNNNIWLGSVSKDSEEGSGSFDIFTDFLVDKIMMFRLFGV